MNIRMEKEKDIRLYRRVVASAISASALPMLNQSTPEVIAASGSATSGGLAGLLAPSPLNR